MKKQELIGKEFELNNFICTIVDITDKYIVHRMRNKGGHDFGIQKTTIEFLPKVLKQLANKNS